MRSLHPLSLVLIGLSPLSLPLRSAQAQAPGPFVCSTRDFAKRIAYVSSIFNAGPDDAMKLDPAWHQVMTSQYGITALPYKSCQGPYPTPASADSVRKKFIDYMKNTMKQQVVELSWTYGGAAPITVTVQAPPPSAPPAAEPATLTEADRKAAEAEVPQAKGYCEQNYKGVFDCDCFARAVLHHRLSHPEEWVGQKGTTQKFRPPVHDLAVGVTFRLDCTECLEDQRLMAWARQTVLGEMSQHVLTHQITQARADAYADCVSKAFPAKWHAHPFLHQLQPSLNEARVPCGNPRG